MGANEFKERSDLDFQSKNSASLLKILINVGLISIFIHIFYRMYVYNVYDERKSCQKVWIIAPTALKSMGAEAPTAPILTGALSCKASGR